MNKLNKFGIVLLSVAALGVVAPALTNNPVLGVSIVKAEEQQEPLKFRISFYDKETGEEIAAEMTGIIRPGETINIHRNIDGYEIASKHSWMPNYEMTYDMVAKRFHGDPDGYRGFYLDYKKLAPTPDPGQKPDQGQGQGQNQNPTPDPGQKPDQGQGQGQNQNPTPDPQSTKQLPETGEKESTFAVLAGLLAAGLAWFTLRKK